MSFYQMIEDAVEQRLRIANAADVMDPDVPLETGPAEHVGEAVGRVVALEHERTLSARAGRAVWRQCGLGDSKFQRSGRSWQSPHCLAESSAIFGDGPRLTVLLDIVRVDVAGERGNVTDATCGVRA